jgi:probable rRNA maturation factor
MKTPRAATTIFRQRDLGLPSAFRSLSSKLESAIVVEITQEKARPSMNESRLREGVTAVIVGEGLQRANISVAVVDDTAIQEINRRFLKHDWPTDVLSFVLEQKKNFVEGEIIISAETAAEAADRFGWKQEDELLLYAVHGALHLVGYDDQSIEFQKKMRDREVFYLNQFGLCPRYEERHA